MAETEELQLRVSLDDQASAQLAALRGQLDQMRGSGGAAAIAQQAAPQIVAAIAPVVQQLTAMAQQLAQLPAQITAAMSSAVQGLQQVQTQLAQVATQTQQTAQAVAAVPGHVREGTQALTGAIRMAGFIGGIAGGATVELINQLSKLGNNLVERSTDFKGLADSMQDLQTHARGVGQSMTGYEGLSRQLQLQGLTAKEAESTISKMSDLSLELKQYGAENAPTTRRLLQDTDPRTSQTIFNTLKQMEGAPIEKQINLWNELKENIQQTMEAENKGEGFEAAWKQISERAGMEPALDKMQEGVRLKKELESPAREENLRARTEETRKFNYESLKASFLWKDIGESFAGSLLHGLGLNTGLVEMNTWLERIRDRALDFEKTWREVSFKAALDQLAQLEPAMKPFTDEIENLIKDIGEIGKELKAVWDWMQQLGKTIVDPDVATKIQRHQMKQEGMSDEQIDKYLKEHPLQPDKTKPYTWEQMQEWWRGRKEPEPPKPAWDPDEYLRKKFNPPGVPEDQIKDYEDRLKGKLPDEQFDPLSGLPLGPKKPEAPTEGKPIIVPPIEVKPTPPPQQPEQKTPPWYGRKREREAPPSQSEPPPQPTPPSQQPEQKPLWFEPSPQRPDIGEGRAANPDPSRFKSFPHSARIEDIRPPGGGVFHSFFDPPTYTKEELDASYAETWKTPAGQAQLKRGKELLDNPPTGTTPLDKLGLSPDKYLKDAYKYSSRRSGGKASSRFVGGEEEDQGSSFDNRFGVWPGMGADKLDQTSAKLDAAANQNVNISGAGKIQVDVRAPPGTSVDASGEGFFKSTEITRLTQMLPADMGPLPMTGVGAGQGVAGNGTVA